MFCTNCGREIPDNASFCPGCGAPAAGAGPSYGGEAYQAQGSPAPRAAMVTDLVKSPLALVFAIIFSADLLFNIIGAYFSVLNLFTYILMAAVCLGCWIAWAGCFTHNTGKTGFSILRFAVPIYLVFKIIVSITQLVPTARYTYGGSRALVIIAYLVALVLWAYVYFCFFRTTNSAWQILNGENVEWEVSLPSLVIFIVLLALSIVGDIVTVVTIYLFVFTALAIFADIAVFILAAVILFRIRNQRMRGSAG